MTTGEAIETLHSRSRNVRPGLNVPPLTDGILTSPRTRHTLPPCKACPPAPIGARQMERERREREAQELSERTKLKRATARHIMALWNMALAAGWRIRPRLQRLPVAAATWAAPGRL